MITEDALTARIADLKKQVAERDRIIHEMQTYALRKAVEYEEWKKELLSLRIEAQKLRRKLEEMTIA